MAKEPGVAYRSLLPVVIGRVMDADSTEIQPPELAPALRAFAQTASAGTFEEELAGGHSSATAHPNIVKRGPTAIACAI